MSCSLVEICVLLRNPALLINIWYSHEFPTWLTYLLAIFYITRLHMSREVVPIHSYAPITAAYLPAELSVHPTVRRASRDGRHQTPGGSCGPLLAPVGGRL